MNIERLGLYYNSITKNKQEYKLINLPKTNYTNDSYSRTDYLQISDRGRMFVKAKEIVEEKNETIREELVKSVKEKIEKNIYFTEMTAEFIADKIVNGWRSWN